MGCVLAAAQMKNSFDVQLCGRQGRGSSRGVGKSSSTRPRGCTSALPRRCPNGALDGRRVWAQGSGRVPPASKAKGGQVAHHSDPMCSYPQNATQWRRRVCLWSVRGGPGAIASPNVRCRSGFGGLGSRVEIWGWAVEALATSSTKPLCFREGGEVWQWWNFSGKIRF